MDPIRIGDWTLDPGVRSLTRDEVEERIEPKMLDVLLVLVEHAGRPVRRRDLERDVWSGAAIGTELLNRTIWKLRRVLGDDPSAPTYIETIPRVGYRLIAPVGEAAEPTPERKPQDPGPARRRRSALAWATGATGVVAVSAAIVLARDGGAGVGPDAGFRIVPLTASPGYEASPSLSPDGRFVAFQRYDREATDPTWDIEILDIESGTTSIVSSDLAAQEYAPAWSPDGDSIAFIVQADECGIVVQAVAGGQVRVADCASDQGHEVAWEADGSLIRASYGSGQTLGLVRIDRHTGAHETLTAPPIGYDGDLRPRPSPDGRLLAFVRQRTNGIADVYVVERRGGEPRRLTFDHRRIGDIAWTADASAIVFSSTRGGDSRLWRVDVAGGDPTALPMSGRNANRLSIGSNSVLVYEEYFGDSDIWAFDPATGTSEPWTGSSRSEWGATVSPDRNTVAFLSDRTGAAEIWTVPAGGGEARRLTRLDGAQVDPPRWSPNSRQLVFAAAVDGDFDVFVVGVDGAAPAEQITDDVADERVPAWWGDIVVYSANRTGTPELWSIDAAGGEPRRLTSGGGAAARPALDGRSLFFTRPDEPGLWQLRPGEQPVRVWPDMHPADGTNWVPAKNGFVYLRINGVAAPRLERIDLRHGTVHTLGVVAAEAPLDAGVDILPDGRILYGRIVRSESDLWIARGLPLSR